MQADLLIHNIGQLVTLAGPTGPRRGATMRELGIITGAAVAIADGRIVAVGKRDELAAGIEPTATLDAGGRVVVPGFVDPHTHLPWAGHRAAEFETTPAEHVTRLARSATIGVTLPGTPFGLGQRDYSPARSLIDPGGALALATDLNPGACWCENMQFIIALACRTMRLLPAEALTAANLNAACAIGLGDQAGSLAPGKLADLVILDADDYRMLAYRFGTNLAWRVVKRGA